MGVIVTGKMCEDAVLETCLVERGYLGLFPFQSMVSFFMTLAEEEI